MADSNSTQPDAGGSFLTSLSLNQYGIPTAMPDFLRGVSIPSPPRSFNPIHTASKYLGFQNEEALAADMRRRWVQGVHANLSNRERLGIYGISGLLFNDNNRLVSEVNGDDVASVDRQRIARGGNPFLTQLDELNAIRDILEGLEINATLDRLERDARKANLGNHSGSMMEQIQLQARDLINYNTCLAVCQYYREREHARNTAVSTPPFDPFTLSMPIRNALRNATSLQRGTILQLAGIVSTLRHPSPVDAMSSSAQQNALEEVLTVLTGTTDPNRIRQARIAVQSSNYLAAHSPFRDISPEVPTDGDPTDIRRAEAIMERAREATRFMVLELSTHVTQDIADENRIRSFLRHQMQADLDDATISLRGLVETRPLPPAASVGTNDKDMRTALGKQEQVIRQFARAIARLQRDAPATAIALDKDEQQVRQVVADVGTTPAEALRIVLDRVVSPVHEGNRALDLVEARTGLRQLSIGSEETATPFRRIEEGAPESFYAQSERRQLELLRDLLPGFERIFEGSLPIADSTQLIAALEERIAGSHGMPDLQMHAIDEVAAEARAAMRKAQAAVSEPSSSDSGPAQGSSGQARAPHRPGGHGER